MNAVIKMVEEHVCVELTALRASVVLALHVCAKPATKCYLCDSLNGGAMYQKGQAITCSSCLFTNWHNVDEWDLIE